MAGAIAMITKFCGLGSLRRSHRKASRLPSKNEEQNSDFSTSPPPHLASPQKPPPTPPLQPSQTAPPETGMTHSLPGETLSAGSENTKENDDISQIKELPLPPAKQLKKAISNNNFLTKSASTRSPSSSLSIKTLSMRLPRTMSLARKDGEENKNQKKKGKLKHEDSVWTKAIILGEKCKVPDEEEAVIYDRKGRRISTYHKKTSSSLHFSRQNSHMDEVNAREKGDSRKERERFC